MNHYLLTWYGITDLRAALGIEPTEGPILSALKTQKYTHIIILAYTNRDKSPDDFTGDMRARWEVWRTSSLETRLKLPREKAQQLVEVLSNTPSGHTLFADWLEKELAANNIVCNIQIIPRELKHLNDAQEIFAAATSALRLTLADSSEKTITTYVSPGTPVMAYTWALIARAHPQHSIAVIASSDPRKLPETIHLPKDLLMPIISVPQITKLNKYDVIMHLLGRERVPIYFGMLQFKAPLHIFITNQEYERGGKTLLNCLPQGTQGKIVTIQDPFKPADTRKAIEKEMSSISSSSMVAINLTGGTKLMFAGALGACWEHGIEPFYFEVNNNNIIFIRDGVNTPFVGAKSVTDFFKINGFDIVTHGYWEDLPLRAARIDVTAQIWELRDKFCHVYHNDAFKEYQLSWKNTQNSPFDWNWKNSRASLDGNGKATLILNGREITVPDSYDYARYLGGAWLEEYVWTLLQTLEAEGLIHDLRIGIEIDYADKVRTPKDAPNAEFDCAFTDGKRLWLVECKAGSVKQEHIQKLENNLKTYGGIAARGIIVSSHLIAPQQMKRVSLSTAIRTVPPSELTVDALRNIIIKG